MVLSESKDAAVQSTEPTVAAGRKWNPREAVLQAQAALRQRDIVGHIQHGHGGLD